MTPGYLLPELLLAALVVMSLATGGMLGLWAATSRWHWFVRTMVVLAVLTPLLWRPIYEPFLTLLTEVAVVVLAVTISRRNWPAWRFSSAGLLMLTVPVAVLVAAAMRGVADDFPVDWLRAIGMGVVSGGVVTLAAWAYHGRSRWWKRGSVLLAALLMFAGLWSLVDYTADLGFFGFQAADLLGASGSSERLLVLRDASFSVAALFLLSVLLVVALGWFASWSSRLARLTATAAVLSVVAGFPVYVAWCLSSPLPLPTTPVAASPGYKKLVALNETPEAQAVEQAWAAEPINHQVLQQAVDEGEHLYVNIRKQLPRQITIPSYFANVFDGDDLQARRGVARLLDAKFVAAMEFADTPAAIAACEDHLRYASRLRGQGVLVDALVTVAIEQIAINNVRRLSLRLDAEQQTQLAWQLATHVQSVPALDSVLYNERIFCENATGWQGHLNTLLEQWSGEEVWGIYDGPTRHGEWHLQLRSNTLSALLATDLALRAYHQQLGIYPSDLEQLVPDYLPAVPTDPCSDTGAPLVYHRTADGYELYSRGYDGDDDGGRPCTATPDAKMPEWIDWQSDGDLSLDAYWPGEE